LFGLPELVFQNIRKGSFEPPAGPLMRAAVTPLIQRFRGGSSSGRATGVKTNY
jgi:hypothetical protein